ncbi:MAG: RNA polymerase sigma factor [Rubrobacter sp.]|nr:RNA polymerase sigma factor [Rubrobacter sp.]
MDTGSKAVEEKVGLDPLPACLANGDPRAPRELVERHHAELYRYALTMLGNSSVAEDAVQEAFERAFVALGRYPGERIRALALRAWLYRIILNVVRNLVRGRSRELLVAEAPDKGFRPVSDLGDEVREAWLDVLAALERLPDRQRVAVTLRYIQDLPYSEIADITGTPLNTVKTLTRRGVERLRILLIDPA